MIYQDDISTAKQPNSSFEIKSLERRRADNSEREKGANDFGKHLEEANTPGEYSNIGHVPADAIQPHDHPKSPKLSNKDNIEPITGTSHSEALLSVDQPIAEQSIDFDLENKTLSHQTDDRPIDIITVPANTQASDVEPDIHPEQDIKISSDLDRTGDLAKISLSDTPDITAVPADNENSKHLPIKDAAQEIKPSPHMNVDVGLSTLAATGTQTALTEGKAPKQGTRKAELVIEAQLLTEDVEVPLDIEVDLAAEKLFATRLNQDTHLNSAFANTQTSAFASANLTQGSMALEASAFGVSSLSSAPLANTASLAVTPNATITAVLTSSSVSTVMQSIVKTVETQKGVSVRLDPPELGRVYIDYIFDGERAITALIRADLPEALSQLRDQSAHLQNFLIEQGFDDVNLSFDQNTPDQQSFDEEQFQDAPNYAARHDSLEPEPKLMHTVNLSEPPLAKTYNQTSIDIKL